MKKGKISLITNTIIFSLLIVVSAICFIPSAYIDALATNENVYYYGNTNSNKISLMFNVYWGTDEVKKILDILDEFNVKSTFFIGGCWADDNMATLKEILERGHELGNHGYFHKDHDKLSLRENIDEISHCRSLVELITGYKTNLFAPPSGAFNEDTINAAVSLENKVIMWSKDTIDWRDKDKNLVYQRATKNAKGGDLILMHPMEHTVDALRDILSYYAQNNLCEVTVSENLGT